MLTIREVKPGELTRYKRDEPVEAGTYYQTSWLPTDVARMVGAIACQDARGKFIRLLPREAWVKRLLDKWEPPLVAGERTIRKWGGHPPFKFRKFQCDLYEEARANLDAYGEYRRGWIARIGAGKTLAGLLVAELCETSAVLAPSHLHDQWREEAERHHRRCPTISTYESAHKLPEVEALVMDEVLAVKNPDAQRAAKALAVSSKAKVVVGFTGTSSSVAPYDLRWLRDVYPGCVPRDMKTWQHLWGHDTQLVEVAPGRSVYVTNNWDNEAISKFVEPFLSVVPPAEIEKELPAVQYLRVKVPKPRRYELILNGAATERSAAKAVAQARQITDGFFYDDEHVAHVMGSEKLDAVAGYVEDTDMPLVIFAAWDWAVQALAERFKDEAPAVLRGENADSYGLEITRFQKGDTRLLIANARIATGMNLQRGKAVLFMSHSLKPDDDAQAIGRIVRPGQDAKQVTVVDFVCEGTLDEVTVDTIRAHQGESEAFVQAALERAIRGRK